MRICICDYSGHPFQVQLSRELARRGHDLLHLFFSEFQTPHGRLQRDADDPPSLAIEGVSLGEPFAKYSFLRRRSQEIAIGDRIARRIAAFAPEIIVGCNLPIDTLGKVIVGSEALRVPFVFWQQDLYSTAIRSVLSRRLGFAGALIGRHYQGLERRAALRSAAIVVITEPFRDLLVEQFGIAQDRITVVENWAPLDEITPKSKRNPWSEAKALSDHETVVYTGTLGMKHDPAKLLALAEALAQRPSARLVVASAGPAADWLRDKAAEAGLNALISLPFQPFDAYPEVLGAADVLVSILEEDAGGYSVPSKVLSYLCAGRPIVLSAPPANAAARILRMENAGVAVPTSDTHAFVAAVIALLDDPERRQAAGAHARRYAETAFNVGAKADAFERVFKTVLKGTR